MCPGSQCVFQWAPVYADITQLLQIRIRVSGNKSRYWLRCWASTDGALNLVTLPQCQQSTGTPENPGILEWEKLRTESLQRFMNRTIYASIFPFSVDGKHPNPTTTTPTIPNPPHKHTHTHTSKPTPNSLTVAGWLTLFLTDGHRNSAFPPAVTWHSCHYHTCNTISPSSSLIPNTWAGHSIIIATTHRFATIAHALLERTAVAV